MDINLKETLDKVIDLLGTPNDYEKYICLRFEPIPKETFQFHYTNNIMSVFDDVQIHSPKSIYKGVLISVNNEKIYFDKHESGPEIIFYSVVAGLIIDGLIKLINNFIKKVQNEHKHITKFKIIKKYQIGEEEKAEEIVEIDLPLTDKSSNELKKKIEQAIIPK